LRPARETIFYFISIIINIIKELNLFTKCVKQEKAKSRDTPNVIVVAKY
jgi:hypothetical protein